MTIPEFSNFPNLPRFEQRAWTFKRNADLSDFAFSAVGGTAPTTANDEAFGSVTLASGTADNNYVIAQTNREFIRLNGLGKTYEFVFHARLSEATQCDAGLGIGIRDTAWLGDSDGLTHGVFLRKADGAASWDLVIARGAASFPADYTAIGAVAAADTSYHTFAIRIVTDPVTLGKGTVVVFVDGAQVALAQVGNLPHEEELTLMFGVRNGDAAGTNKNLTVALAGCRLER